MQMRACLAADGAVGMGAVMGSLVGVTIGFIGGGFQILRCVQRCAAQEVY